MKKFLIGCGVVFLLLVGLLLLGGFWVVRTGKNYVNQFQAIEQDYKGLESDFPFTQPADGKLAEDRLLAWLSVREIASGSELQEYKKLQTGGARAVLSTVNNIPVMLRQHAVDLRRENMSESEYTWITTQVKGALKSRPAAQDPSLAGLAAKVEAPLPEAQSGNFKMNQEQHLVYAPLGADEARPILELIKKHQDRMGKVAHVMMLDQYLADARKQHSATPHVAVDNRATTR